MVRKNEEMVRNGLRWSKFVQKHAKMARCNPNLLKLVLNSPKRNEIMQNILKQHKTILNDPKRSKTAQNGFKQSEMLQKVRKSETV
jgi:hypothetical protein